LPRREGKEDKLRKINEGKRKGDKGKKKSHPAQGTGRTILPWKPPKPGLNKKDTDGRGKGINTKRQIKRPNKIRKKEKSPGQKRKEIGKTKIRLRVAPGKKGTRNRNKLGRSP